MKQQLRFSIYGLGFLAALLGGCAQADGPEGDAAAEPETVAGIWMGATGDGGPVTFTVSDDEILTDVRMQLAVDVIGGSCTAEFVAQPLADVSGRAFDHRGILENAGGTIDVTLHASFGDDTAHGDYEVHSFALVCGNYYVVGTSGGDVGSFELSRAAAQPDPDPECRPSDCMSACHAVYACGLESDDAGQLCPGFGPDRITVDAFLYGQQNDGCLAACDAQPALVDFVDACSCADTVSTLGSLSSPFASACGG